MRLPKFLILPIFLLLFLQTSSSVAAQIGAVPIKNISTSTAALKQTATGLKQEAADLRASAAAVKQQRKDLLSEVKVQACQARQVAIGKRSDQMVKRAVNQQDVFGKIAQRVEEFYQTKLVPQGKTVPNYDALVSDITTKSAALTPLIVKASSDAATFSCDKDHPSEQVLGFNQDMKAVISALETYRKSVRNLIVEVKSVKGLENSATSSAKPITTQ